MNHDLAASRSVLAASLLRATEQRGVASSASVCSLYTTHPLSQTTGDRPACLHSATLLKLPRSWPTNPAPGRAAACWSHPSSRRRAGCPYRMSGTWRLHLRAAARRTLALCIVSAQDFMNRPFRPRVLEMSVDVGDSDARDVT
jgi:hypothetical protein